LTTKETPFLFITECGAEKIKFTYLSRLVSDYRYKLLFKARRPDEGNMLESKMAQDCRLCLQPVKRLKVQPLYEGGFPE